MKKYEKPIIDILEIEASIITSSLEVGDTGRIEDSTDWGELQNW